MIVMKTKNYALLLYFKNNLIHAFWTKFFTLHFWRGAVFLNSAFHLSANLPGSTFTLHNWATQNLYCGGGLTAGSFATTGQFKLLYCGGGLTAGSLEHLHNGGSKYTGRSRAISEPVVEQGRMNMHRAPVWPPGVMPRHREGVWVHNRISCGIG